MALQVKDAEEIASLDRVLTRLALTGEDSKLQNILQKLLPRLILRLNNSDEVRKKTCEVLEHIEKRVKDNRSICLPCSELLKNIEPGRKNSGLVFTFALKFAEIGIDRATATEKASIAPRLFSGICSLGEADVLVILRILCDVLPFISIAGEMTTFFPENTSAEDKNFVLGFFLDVLLYPFGSARYLQADESATIPGGLSPIRIDRLRRKDDTFLSQSDAVKLQSALLTFLLSGVFPDYDIIPLLLVGCNAPNSEISSVAEQGLRRILPNIDFSNASLLQALFSLADVSQKRSADPLPRKQFGAAIRDKALDMLVKVKSEHFAPVLTHSIHLVENCLFSGSISPRFKVLLLKLCSTIIVECSRLNSEEATDIPERIVALLYRLMDRHKGYSADAIPFAERDGLFSCISVSARHFPALFSKNTALVSQLLDRLSAESDTRISVQEALGNICRSFCAPYAVVDTDSYMKKILFGQLNSNESRVRFVVSQYYRRLFPFADIEARFVSLLLSCDPDSAVRNEAVRGLVPEFCGSREIAVFEGDLPTDSKDEQDGNHWIKHTLSVLADSIKADPHKAILAWVDKDGQPSEYAIFVRKVHANVFPRWNAWLDYLLNENRLDSIVHQAKESSDYCNKLSALLGFSRACLEQQRVFIKINSTDQGRLKSYRGIIESCLKLRDHSRSRVLHRVALRCLVDLFAFESNDESLSQISADWLLEWLKADSAIIRETTAMLSVYCAEATSPPVLGELLVRMKTTLISDIPSRHGAVAAAGYLLNSGSLIDRVDVTKQQALCHSLCATLRRKGEVKRVLLASVKSLGLAADGNHLYLSKDELCEVVHRLGYFLEHRYGEANSSVDPHTINALVCAAAETMSKLVNIPTFADHRNDIVAHLFGAESHKELTIRLGIGMALSRIVRRDSVVAVEIFERLLYETTRNNSSHIRAAGSIWLLQLVRDCGNFESMQHFLELSHSTFATLLRDRDILTREVSARGMAWCYLQAKTNAVKDNLLTSLPRLLSVKTAFVLNKPNGKDDGSLKAPNEAKELLDCDTGDDPESEDKFSGSRCLKKGRTELVWHPVTPLSLVYKYILIVCMKAVERRLVYHFFYLSVADPLWTLPVLQPFRIRQYDVDSEDEVISKPDPENLPHSITDRVFKRLVPILYRYRYDSDKSLRFTMSRFWDYLVIHYKSEEEITRTHFTEIVLELSRNCSSKVLRERCSGAIALANLLRKGSPQQVFVHLDSIWRVSLRLFDDVSDASKEAAAQLSDEVSKMTLRLCSIDEDTTQDNAEFARNALDFVMPFMLKEGVRQSCGEAHSICMLTLSKIVKVSKNVLSQYMVKIVEILLENMSGMEDVSLGYAMFHTKDRDGYIELSGLELERMRVQISDKSPMQEAINLCIDCIGPGKELDELGSTLLKVAQSCVGLLSVMATCKVIGRLFSRREVRSELSKHAGSLLYALSNRLRDRSILVRENLTSTCAMIAPLAPETSKGKYIEALLSLYNDSVDAEHRRTCGNGLSELLQRSPEVYKEFEIILLPFIFLASEDNDAEISCIFRDLLSENVGSVSSGAPHMLGRLLQHCLNDFLNQSQWERRKQALECIHKLAIGYNASELNDCFEETMNVLCTALPGQVWDGKEVIFKVLVCVWKKRTIGAEFCAPFTSTLTLIETVIFPELSRQSTSDSYTSAAFGAVAALGLFMKESEEYESSVVMERNVNQLIEITQDYVLGQRSVGEHVVAKSFEAIGSLWCDGLSQNVHDLFLQVARKALRGVDNHEAVIGALSGMKNVHSYSYTTKCSLVWMRASMNLVWNCIVQSKKPTIVVVALHAIREFFLNANRNFDEKGAHSGIEELSDSCLARLQPLLKHRDSSVVFACSQLQSTVQGLYKKVNGAI